MAKKIPPANFYKLPKQEQEMEAVRKMNECYNAGDMWKALSIQARSRQIQEPKEIDRPDLAIMKEEWTK